VAIRAGTANVWILQNRFLDLGVEAHRLLKTSLRMRSA
jgi:hypothetical protein